MVLHPNEEETEKVKENSDRLIVEEIPTKEHEERLNEARYLQDKATLDSHIGKKPCTSQDLAVLNVLPENYERWLVEMARKEFIFETKTKIRSWVQLWNKDRMTCLAEIKDFVKTQDIYTKTEIEDWVREESNKEKKEEDAPADKTQINEFERQGLRGYLELKKEKKFGEASEMLVDMILRRYKIYTTKDDVKTEMWIYKDGVYVPQGKSEVKEFIRNFLGKFYTQTDYNMVIAKLEPDTFIDIDKFFVQNHIDEIPVSNGILNIHTRELKPFTSEKVFFSKIPVTFDPHAECPQIEKFLSETLANQDDKMVFYELGGFCLLKEYKFEKAFMFVGNGRNGKDKSLELLKRTIGINNCCSVPLSSLVPDSFVISEFFGKMVNIAGEINNQDLKDTTMFKALTGRSLVSGQRKYLQPITFQNFAKFVFACNELPMVYDSSKGFWDRWVLLEFPYTFLPEEEISASKDKTYLKIRDPDIIEKITTPRELSGLLNRFLDGFDRLKAHKEFSSTKGSDYIKNLWIRKSNSFMAFCLDHIEDDYDGAITKKELRKRYLQYNREHKLNSKSDYVIKKILQENYGVIEDRETNFGITEYIWRGVRWKH